MTKIDRLKELEKIAERLGIGQNKEVDCLSCKKKIKFIDAIILTNKEKVKYLCQECNKKIEAGDLNKQQEDWRKILKEIEDTKDNRKNVPWEPYYPEKYPTITDPIRPIYEQPYRIGDVTYIVSTRLTDRTDASDSLLLKLNPNNADNTSK